MTVNTLAKLFEHNNWANGQLVTACSALTDEQLDATPWTDSEWSLRRTVSHLVEAQQDYLSMLTLRPDAGQEVRLAFDELPESVRASGEGLLALAREEDGTRSAARLKLPDGYVIEAWVVMLQAINHATDHRRQICGMLRVLGVAPPRLDGWAFGESEKAVVPPST